ncbi:MAG: hypothetical protein FD137_2028 [Spirochaetes bacterium]|nr:MAG: hypothetical protein FD137_2028 [Spirochaetota bacterium]
MKHTPSSAHDEEEIAALARQLTELRQAVRRNNPLLKTVATSAIYPSLALGLGAILSGLSIYVHFSGNISNFLFALLALFGLSGGIKIALTASIVKKHDARGFSSLVKSIYGGKTGSLILGAGLAIGVCIFFLANAGLPWYIVPAAAVFISFASHALDIVIDLVEYRVLGWASLAAGLAALFFVEQAPWIWVTLSLGLPFMLFGIAGIYRASVARRS